jgi:lysozyme
VANEVALALIRRFEGCRLTPYLCPAGIPTIGYGSTHYLDGTAVTLLDPPISKLIAEGLLQASVERLYLPAVRKLCPNIDDPNRLAAIIDFTYNLGMSRLKASTLRQRINEGQWDSVPAELRKWTFARGRKQAGLIRRREAEIALFSMKP